MDSDTVQKIIDSSTEAIKDVARDTIVRGVGESIGWSAREIVAAEVKKFTKEEIAPEVAKYLASEKGVILEAVKKSAEQVGEIVAAKMLEQATEALSSYRGEEIIKSLMGGR